jgi:multidrug resistance efflux pump
MRFNGFYILVAILFGAMLFLTLKFFRGSGHASVGVTNSRVYKINSEKSALVKTIPVVPGQEIKEGELLVELTSSELEMSLEKLMHKIAVLRSDQREKAKLADSKIALIRAESGIKVEELNTDITESETDLSLNRQIVKSHNIKWDSTTEQPVSQKIKALKKQRSKQEEASAIRIQDILQENQTEQSLLNNQITLLQRELDLLYEEKKKLSKYASSAGVVESVYVKQGEQVESFTPLLSLNSVHPTTVVGYLVGKKESLPVGSDVMVRSYEKPRHETPGKIIGYGSVVELPEILQKSTAVKAFGREVFIEIMPDNQFAAGEKVLIR